MIKCAFCNETTGLESHHLIPRSLGGSDEPSNRLILCSFHHGAIHGMKRRGNIAELTRQGLARAKARGVKLGGINSGSQKAKENSTATRVAVADAFARKLFPSIQALRAEGLTVNEIAQRLNDQGVRTARDTQWYGKTVCNLIRRCDEFTRLQRTRSATDMTEERN